MSGTELDLDVVIPVGPGDEHWRSLLPRLNALPVRSLRLVLVADTVLAPPLPAEMDARVEVAYAPRGRALQMNAGALCGQARWLWFLHADSVPGPDTVHALRAHLAGSERRLGYFDLRFLPDGPRCMALNTWGAWLRSRWLGIPFGDQGLLLSRALFVELGGFDSTLDSGEDHQLIWRARAAGAELHALGVALYTSARKYAERGWWRTTARHLRLTWSQARRFSRQARP